MQFLVCEPFMISAEITAADFLNVNKENRIKEMRRKYSRHHQENDEQQWAGLQRESRCFSKRTLLPVHSLLNITWINQKAIGNILCLPEPKLELFV